VRYGVGILFYGELNVVCTFYMFERGNQRGTDILCVYMGKSMWCLCSIRLSMEIGWTKAEWGRLAMSYRMEKRNISSPYRRGWSRWVQVRRMCHPI
jgi:hypothetical protein